MRDGRPAPAPSSSTVFPATASSSLSTISSVPDQISAMIDRWRTGRDGGPRWAVGGWRVVRRRRVLEWYLMQLKFGRLWLRRQGGMGEHCVTQNAKLLRLRSKSLWAKATCAMYVVLQQTVIRSWQWTAVVASLETTYVRCVQRKSLTREKESSVPQPMTPERVARADEGKP